MRTTQGFLKDLQGYFRSEFSGRYLAAILKELGNREPAAFKSILASVGSKNMKKLSQSKEALRLDSEYSFVGKKSPDNKTAARRADLAVFFGDEKSPRLLIEIKEKDINNGHNECQIHEYLRYSKKHETIFIYLTFSPPPERLRNLLKKNNVPVLYYRDVLRVLIKYLEKSKNRPIFSQHVIEYLEDSNVAKYQPFPISGRDKKDLDFLISQLLPLPYRCGLGRLCSKNRVHLFPTFINTVIGNLEVIAEHFRRSNADSEQSYTPIIQMKTLPWIDHKKKNNVTLKTLFDKDGWLEVGKMDGGTVYLYVQMPLTNYSTGGWSYLEINFEFDFEVGRGTSASLSVRIYGQKLKNDAYSCQELNRFPSEDASFKIIARLLKDAKKQCQGLTSDKQMLNAIKAISFDA